MVEAEGEAQLPSEAPAARAPARPILREFYAKLLVVIFLMALMCLLILQVPWASDSTSASQDQTTPQLAELMFEGYGAGFVLLSIVMGVAIIGGLFLAREDPAEEGGEEGKETGGSGGADGDGGGGGAE